MYIHSDPRRASDPHALPDVEIFYSEGKRVAYEEDVERGWYYQYCFPGCLPDGELTGPFETYEEATEDLYENANTDSNYEDNE